MPQPANAKKRFIRSVLPWAIALAVFALSIPLFLFSEIVVSVVIIARQVSKLPEIGPALVSWLEITKWLYLAASILLAAMAVRRTWVTYVFWGWAATGLFRVAAVVALLLELTNRVAIAKVAAVWLVSFLLNGLLIHWAEQRTAERGSGRK